MKQISPLPIDKHLPDILKLIANYSTVLVKASPGSGKTTRLPWEITKKLGKRVAVLEPRRLAAKLAAQRIADENGLSLGKEVGYHFRFERNISANTELIFYTEGTFLKKFQNDTLINDIDVIVLDEFHERHLETDLALALLREIQTKRDLKIVIMSATLDLKLQEAFKKSATFEIEAPHFPVEIRYLLNQPSILNQPLEKKIKDALSGCTTGDALIFIPGMREMLKVKDHLQANYNVFLLHADLTKEEQEEALEKSTKRKIILASSIAESSVTIPGITIVIDSGIQRSALYSPWNGLKFITDSPTTKSSAIQRAGRAGRTAPGVCIRLYSKQDFDERREFTVPEIETADLTDICLLVQKINITPQWIESPPSEKWKKAKALLELLGAIENDEVTTIGKKMLAYPLDARLSRVLCEGENLDKKSKIKLLDYLCYEIEEDRTGNLKRRLNFYLESEGKETNWENCILQGFRDQISLWRPKQKDFIHYSGKTIKGHPSLSELSDKYYLILDITQRQEAIKVFPVEEEWFWELKPFAFTEEDDIDVSEKITIRKKTKLGSIVIEESIIRPQWENLTPEIKKQIVSNSQSKFLNLLNQWKETSTYERFHYWAIHQKVSLDELLETIKLESYFNQYGTNFENLETFLQGEIEEKLSLTDLDRSLPLKINFGGRRELVVHYPINMTPYLEAPIQDFYGLNETPKILGGKVSLTLKLLGPHKRPIQVTSDLPGFWQKTYQEMKKEYQRDYPRHYWPDKPWEARPFLLKSHLPKA